MKKRKKTAYKVCPILYECTNDKTYTAARCTDCPLNPAMTNRGFVKHQLKFLRSSFRKLILEIELRYPRFSFCVFPLFTYVLISFFAGMFFVHKFLR